MKTLCTITLAAGITATASGADVGTYVGPLQLLSPDQIGNWQVAAGPKIPWTLEDGVYRGHRNWVGYAAILEDFILECDFFFDGKGEGGIAFRTAPNTQSPWQDGYELDIDWAGDKEKGHIHFPGNPKSYIGEALFDAGKWHTVRIVAEGKSVTVFLDGQQSLQFESGQFMKGQICLEGHETGVKYRNIVLTKI